MIPAPVVYTLALIGTAVVLVLAAVAAWFAAGVAIIKLRTVLRWCEKRLFYAAGGQADDTGEGRLPHPPFDRLWIELRWLEQSAKWLETQLGFSNYRNPGRRPDIDRLYELRREDHGVGRWGWLPDFPWRDSP